MSLALFDLDNTLIAGDSAQSFSEFLVSSGFPVADDFIDRNIAFMQDYDAGCLDLDAYMRLTLSPLVGRQAAEYDMLITCYVEQVVEGMILPKGLELLQKHREAGDDLVLVSATGAHLVKPIARRLGIDHVLAVNLQTDNGYLTGNIEGVPTFREGKVTRVREWAAEHGHDYRRASFYSDSRNDIPLLEAVAKPVAVDPDEHLLAVARSRDWPILSLR